MFRGKQGRAGVGVTHGGGMVGRDGGQTPSGQTRRRRRQRQHARLQRERTRDAERTVGGVVVTLFGGVTAWTRRRREARLRRLKR
ncbi:hypothetical protein ACFP9V_26615 [Deinococcus radiopugnans]|uniref:hypothetical protein n=1 Tax=Deinococcus radiopugnans TaxID=57497 RepID=UPI003606696F